MEKVIHSSKEAQKSPLSLVSLSSVLVICAQLQSKNIK